MTTQAERQLAIITGDSHTMTHPVIDDGFTERFTRPDGSELIYDHTANAGFEWSAA